MESNKSKEELNALREGQKRLTWINNVKRIQNLTQEEAELKWELIYGKSPNSRTAFDYLGSVD